MSLGAGSRSVLFLLSPLPLQALKLATCAFLNVDQCLRLLILRGTTSVSLNRLVFGRYQFGHCYYGYYVNCILKDYRTQQTVISKQ